MENEVMKRGNSVSDMNNTLLRIKQANQRKFNLLLLLLFVGWELLMFSFSNSRWLRQGGREYANALCPLITVACYCVAIAFASGAVDVVVSRYLFTLKRQFKLIILF